MVALTVAEVRRIQNDGAGSIRRLKTQGISEREPVTSFETHRLQQAFTVVGFNLEVYDRRNDGFLKRVAAFHG